MRIQLFNSVNNSECTKKALYPPLRLIFGGFAFIMIRQFRSDKRSGKGPRAGIQNQDACSAVCWRAAHAAIGDDKNLKVLIKCYLSTDQQRGQQILAVRLASSALN